MNARRLREAILLPVLALGCGTLQAHGAHEHGVAEMDVAQDGTELQIELSTPAANLIGFEHPPRNAREQAILRDAVTALEQGGGLLAPSAAAACTLRDARILSALLSTGDDGHEHDDGDHDHSPDDDHDHDDHDHAHADVFVAWRFDCATPAALRELDARGLFTRFPGTETLRVQAVVPRGQLAGTLTSRKPVFRF
jgi:hypothetical protein